MKKRYCKDCAFLLLFDVGSIRPVCTATAKFENGPLRDDMDVSGVVPAIERNRDNDCEFYSRFGNRESRRIKKWIIKRLSTDGRERGLGDYPRESELRQLRAYRREEEHDEADEYDEDDETDEYEEDDAPCEAGTPPGACPRHLPCRSVVGGAGPPPDPGRW